MTNSFKPSRSLDDVRYEIRGPLAQRAHDLEFQGYDVISLNIGNPGRFGFRAPESLRLAIIENLSGSDAYCHQKGIFPAREAVVMQQQERGILSVSADDVFIGNGVSELIDLTLRALLDPDDEVLIPSPDYPLWTAAVTLNRGKAVHYPCPRELGFAPDLDALESLVTESTRALVIINPNNPTGAVYSKETLQRMVAIAERHQLIIFTDEIYEDMTYDEAKFYPVAPMVTKTLVGTFSGLSKVYRACGYRVGWVSFAGDKSEADAYLEGLDTLASLRLCSNVPGQWAVQTALGGHQSIHELIAPGGRLHESRQAVIEAVKASPYLSLVAPAGAIYAFIGIDNALFPDIDDHEFALELLEIKHVLIAPGSSFNVAYRNHFRITLLPDAETLREVFLRIDEVLSNYRSRKASA
ncbi:MAG: aminotransferase class I/II-fold pyridoxal phosphate-dependent enzyme [Gammaproteobacteria bacterium]|nr:aminotransferase class I/II-fold pyridoxal phosphate-dependent enzyme [Gammaproteobacteria bacterium]